MSDVDSLSDFLRFVERRQRIGIAKYGHGVRREQDTRRFGTHDDSWWEMAQEEIGDAASYVVCARLRSRGDARDPAADDDNAAVLRAIAERRDPAIVELARLWYAYEDLKSPRDVGERGDAAPLVAKKKISKVWDFARRRRRAVRGVALSFFFALFRVYSR